MTKAKSTLDNGVSTNDIQGSINVAKGRKPKATQPKPITKPQRQLKVQKGYYEYQDYQEHGTQSAISELLLKGKWLNDAGFAADSSVKVQVKRGKLVITAE